MSNLILNEGGIIQTLKSQVCSSCDKKTELPISQIRSAKTWGWTCPHCKKVNGIGGKA